MHFLLTVLHLFLMVIVGRICIQIKSSLIIISLTLMTCLFDQVAILCGQLELRNSLEKLTSCLFVVFQEQYVILVFVTHQNWRWQKLLWNVFSSKLKTVGFFSSNYCQFAVVTSTSFLKLRMASMETDGNLRKSNPPPPFFQFLLFCFEKETLKLITVCSPFEKLTWSFIVVILCTRKRFYV